MSQATVQAALALSPLDAVIAAYKSAPKSAQALRYTQYANETLTTAIFCILIDASIGTLLIRAFAPALLQRVSPCCCCCAGGDPANNMVFKKRTLQRKLMYRCACIDCNGQQLLGMVHDQKRRCAALCCAVLCCAVLCCAALRCAALCCAVLCCVVLCCAET